MTATVPGLTYASGPTWQKNSDGSWKLPEYSIGWALLSWAGQWLKQPNGDHAGQPFLFTPEQARFLLWWYAVDGNGRFVYRSGVLRRLKGWGKDPLAATMCLMELCGPVRFSHWEGDRPIGKPASAPLIQLLAVTQDQTDNTFSLFMTMISDELKTAHKMEHFKTMIVTKDGGKIQSESTNPYKLEGNRPTFVLQNETQFWFSANLGHKMAEVVDGNVAKGGYHGARVLSICNAHVPGQDSIAERDYDYFNQVNSGQAVDTGFLYDNIEAPADTDILDEDSLRRGLEIARGDAHWLDIESYVNTILDRRRVVSESRRKFLNQVNAVEDSWLAPYEWDACADPTLSLAKGDRITLAFDGSKTDDHTAIVACRIEDGAIFPIRVWDPREYMIDGEPRIPRDQVDAEVARCFAEYKVLAFFADVAYFESYVDKWANEYGKTLQLKAGNRHSVAWDMRSAKRREFAVACESFYDSVMSEQLRHNGNGILRQHVSNARRHPIVVNGEVYVSIRKEHPESRYKIDAAVVAVMAHAARQELIRTKNVRKGKGLVLSW